MARPTADEVKAYLDQNGLTYTEAKISSALKAETAAQDTVVKADRLERDDVAEALCRRVARNLAMRNLPLGVQITDAGATALGSNDPEVRRLERPHRKVAVG